MVHLRRTSEEKRPGRGRQRINPREFATTGPRTPKTAANYLLYASQEFHAQLLTYGAAQIEPTNSGLRHTSRQAPTAAASNSS